MKTTRIPVPRHRNRRMVDAWPLVECTGGDNCPKCCPEDYAQNGSKHRAEVPADA